MSEADFAEGRYLYCAVAVGEESDAADAADVTDAANTTGTTHAADETFSVTGVDDEPTRLIEVGNFVVVVHDCASLYDSDEIDLVRKWLLEHQQVIDTAGERFGTPLPFRFDTILRGDDDRVREWVSDHRETIEHYLDELAGFWEYHVEVTVDEADLEAGLEADDERLGDLTERLEEADTGTAFMVEKQYDQRLSELKRQRRDRRIELLEDRLSEVTREVHDQGTDSGSSVLEGDASDVDEADEADEANETYTLARLTLLAHEDREGDVGRVLDDVADDPGVTVRFTGPWAPYTFAPELGEEGPDESGSDEESS